MDQQGEGLGSRGGPGGLASSVECILGLDINGLEGIPGVHDSLVGDERRGHGANAKHLPDGGLQQHKVVPVTHSWCAAETYVLFDLLLDLLLQLGAREEWM